MEMYEDGNDDYMAKEAYHGTTNTGPMGRDTEVLMPAEDNVHMVIKNDRWVITQECADEEEFHRRMEGVRYGTDKVTIENNNLFGGK